MEGGGGSKQQLSLVLVDEAILLRDKRRAKSLNACCKWLGRCPGLPEGGEQWDAGIWSWNGANSRLERQNFVNFGAALASVAGCVGQAIRMQLHHCLKRANLQQSMFSKIRD